MATSGQLKTKIDVLKKKIAEKGSSLPADRRRRLTKRLKRMQRSRRVALAAETKRAGKSKGAPAATEQTAPPPAQA